MKIGLIASGYNCEQFLAECVAGWKQFKAHGEHELVCSVVHNFASDNKRQSALLAGVSAFITEATAINPCFKVYTFKSHGQLAEMLPEFKFQVGFE